MCASPSVSPRSRKSTLAGVGIQCFGPCLSAGKSRAPQEPNFHVSWTLHGHGEQFSQVPQELATERDELDQGSGRREEPRGCTSKTHAPCCHGHPTDLCSTKPLRKGPNPGGRATALPRELYLLWKCLLELYKNNLWIGLPHA